MNLMNLMNTRTCAAAVVVAVISLLAGPGESQIPNPESQAAAGTRGQQPVLGYDDTPMQPNGRWRIHDSRRPQPSLVTPGSMSSSPTASASPWTRSACSRSIRSSPRAGAGPLGAAAPSRCSAARPWRRSG